LLSHNIHNSKENENLIFDEKRGGTSTYRSTETGKRYQNQPTGAKTRTFMVGENVRGRGMQNVTKHPEGC